MPKRKLPDEKEVSAVAASSLDVVDPHKNDVLSGRGDSINKHPGNKYFRKLVEKKKKIYATSLFKREKRMISASIVSEIRDLDPPGRFLSKNIESGLWQEIGDEKAKEKTSQALREKTRSIREVEMDAAKASSKQHRASELGPPRGYSSAWTYPSYYTYGPPIFQPPFPNYSFPSYQGPYQYIYPFIPPHPTPIIPQQPLPPPEALRTTNSEPTVHSISDRYYGTNSRQEVIQRSETHASHGHKSSHPIFSSAKVDAPQASPPKLPPQVKVPSPEDLCTNVKPALSSNSSRYYGTEWPGNNHIFDYSQIEPRENQVRHQLTSIDSGHNVTKTTYSKPPTNPEVQVFTPEVSEENSESAMSSIYGRYHGTELSEHHHTHDYSRQELEENQARHHLTLIKRDHKVKKKSYAKSSINPTALEADRKPSPVPPEVLRTTSELSASSTYGRYYGTEWPGHHHTHHNSRQEPKQNQTQRHLTSIKPSHKVKKKSCAKHSTNPTSSEADKLSSAPPVVLRTSVESAKPYISGRYNHGAELFENHRFRGSSHREPKGNQEGHHFLTSASLSYDANDKFYVEPHPDTPEADCKPSPVSTEKASPAFQQQVDYKNIHNSNQNIDFKLQPLPKQDGQCHTKNYAASSSFDLASADFLDINSLMTPVPVEPPAILESSFHSSPLDTSVDTGGNKNAMMTVQYSPAQFTGPDAGSLTTDLTQRSTQWPLPNQMRNIFSSSPIIPSSFTFGHSEVKEAADVEEARYKATLTRERGNDGNGSNSTL